MGVVVGLGLLGRVSYCADQRPSAKPTARSTAAIRVSMLIFSWPAQVCALPFSPPSFQERFLFAIASKFLLVCSFYSPLWLMRQHPIRPEKTSNIHESRNQHKRRAFPEITSGIICPVNRFIAFPGCKIQPCDFRNIITMRFRRISLYHFINPKAAHPQRRTNNAKGGGI